MTRFQKMISSVSVVSVLSLGLVGIASASPDAPADNGAQARGHEHGGHHRGGDLVHAALRLPSLRADQRARIEATPHEEKAAHACVHIARGALMQALAVGVEAGRVDGGSLKPQVDAVAQAEASAKPAGRTAIEALHGVLDSAQRAELVAAIDAHRPPPSAEGAARADAAPRGGHEMGPWSRALDLTPAQRDQIRANLKAERDADGTATAEHQAHAAIQAEHAKMLEAFKGDTFAVSDVAPVGAAALARGPERMVASVQAIVPVLTPAQRRVAAAAMRAEAQRDVQK